MPVAVSYPGVYLEEVSSGVRSIAGVSTSIAAFVDNFPAGPLDEATRVLSFAEFEKIFGGLSATSEASYGLSQFFLNGGSEAYVVRVTSPNHPAASASVGIPDTVGSSSPVLAASAADPGAWGNTVRIDVDYNTTDPTNTFNLTVTETATNNGVTSVIATETYRNLVLAPGQPNDVAAVVNASSNLVNLTESGTTRPAPTGTMSAPVAPSNLGGFASGAIHIALGSASADTAALPSTPPATIIALAAALQGLIRGAQSGGNAICPNATVTVDGDNRLIFKAGTANPSDILHLSDATSTPTVTVATDLGFTGTGTGTQNVQQYALGATAPTAGGDGTWNPTSDAAGITAALMGSQTLKTGMYALLDVDIFNILCIPATMNLPDPDAATIAAQAEALCTARRAMYILDTPSDSGANDSVDGILTWLSNNSGLRSRNAALYFPRVDIADPLNGFRLRPVAPSGTLAGVWASTDTARGVWKAPAGIGATLGGVQKLEYKLTDLENGVLNPLAINALRTFPVYGPVSWGARTLYGADQLVDDYKYVPIRRLALYIEESLYRGTQWVVFEPNDAPLWAQIRLNVGAFMQTLFRQGAFAGSTPADAYFVNCDATTNPQSDINLGIVNVIVGFAPLKPAEFVVIQIQQMAGQIAS